MNTGTDLDKRLNVITSAVYLLFENDIVVYVGESSNPLSRIGTHIRQKVFTSYRILKCHPDRRRYWEKVLILKYQPRYNKTHKKKWIKDNLVISPRSSKYPIKRYNTTGLGAYTYHDTANTWMSTSMCSTSGIGTTSATIGNSIMLDSMRFNSMETMTTSASGQYTVSTVEKSLAKVSKNKSKNNQKKSAVN
jgi:hypothetical protein